MFRIPLATNPPSEPTAMKVKPSATVGAICSTVGEQDARRFARLTTGGHDPVHRRAKVGMRNLLWNP